MKACLFCQNKYTPTHGNQQYCSNECKTSQKAATQQKLYGTFKEFRKGFLGNYKLFEQLLPKTGKKTYSLTELNNSGFKHNCYYKAYTDANKNTWYFVSNYSFSIQKTGQDFLLTLINK